MTDTEIDEGAWAELYVTGRLQGADLDRFEAHLVDCPGCLDRVDAAAKLGAAVGRASRAPAPAAPRRVRQHWARRVGEWSVLVAAVVLAVGSWVVARRARQAEAELAARLSATEQQLAQTRQQIDRAPAPSVSPAPSVPRAVSVPVLVLLATRGGDVPVLRLPEPAGGPHGGAGRSSPLLSLPGHAADPRRSGRLARHGCARLAGGGLRRARLRAHPSWRLSVAAGGNGTRWSLDSGRRSSLPDCAPRQTAIVLRPVALPFRVPERSAPCLVPPNPPQRATPSSSRRC